MYYQEIEKLLFNIKIYSYVSKKIDFQRFYKAINKKNKKDLLYKKRKCIKKIILYQKENIKNIS